MFNILIALGIIALQACIVFFIYALIWKKPYVKKIVSYAPVILGCIFIGSTVGSLIYEYGLGYEPCLLCWYQRIFIFGITILACTGDIRNNKTLQKQVLLFSILGGAIALVHNYIDIIPSGIDICGAGPSCLKRYVYEFGYITIPMMSLTVLLSGALISWAAMRFPHQDLESKEKSAIL